MLLYILSPAGHQWLIIKDLYLENALRIISNKKWVSKTDTSSDFFIGGSARQKEFRDQQG